MSDGNYYDLPLSCPKCGYIGKATASAMGRLCSCWSDPRFRLVTLDGNGYLEFACERCGCCVQRPTVDQREAEPAKETR